jgi:RecA-family ATPase
MSAPDLRFRTVDPQPWRDKLRCLDLPACKGRPRPQPRFVIDGWAPIGVTGALTGIGGRGKTTVAQTCASCIQLGIDWFGCIVQPRPAVMWFGEESIDDIEARQHDINAYYRADFTDQADLHLVSLKGEDCTLFAIGNDKSGAVHTTPLFDTFREMVLDVRAGFVALDHWGLIVAGPEGDRHATGTVINLLSGIAEAADGFILVLQHPSRAAESEYSGNTGFYGGVRALWHMKDGKTDDERVLRRSKGQQGRN